MFYYLSGNMVHKDLSFAVIDVGGVGYKVFSSLKSLETLPLNQPCKMYTYMYIREDAMDIFGFPTTEELSAFEMLLSVSGVGPKAALAVLSVMSVSELIVCISTNDHKPITKAQGVGPKMAQRIILELKDKIGSISADPIIPSKASSADRSTETSAVNALVSLGYSGSDAQRAVAFAMEKEDKLENIIREALKLMM